MSSELADLIDGTPGRFVPQEMRGELVEAEHLTRYEWACSLARGARVLDAGCGVGYGTRMLAAAGAAEAVGVDLAPEAVEAARAEGDDGARFEVADVRELPFADGSFDLVVCFEVIEHVDEQDRTADELRRVLADDGVLVVSSPNPDVYMPGNPHHRHELRPAELRELAAARFRNVRLLEQRNHVASSLVAEGGDGAGARIQHVEAPEAPVYALAVAGDGPLPDVPDLVTLASPLDIKAWVERFSAQQEHIENQAAALDELRRRAKEMTALERRLADAENEAAEMPALRGAAEEAIAAHAQIAEELERARAVIRGLQESLSWKVTTPLRTLKRRAPGRSR